MEKKTYLILHNIRSVHNTGSIFRTADAAGVSKIFLSGYTPSPTDRFGRARKDLAKVSLGAEKSVAWERVADVIEHIAQLRAQGVCVMAIEQSAGSVDYRATPHTSSRTFVFGNETEGLSENVLNACDLVVEIPMRGTKESLNVSVAVGVILFVSNSEKS